MNEKTRQHLERAGGRREVDTGATEPVAGLENTVGDVDPEDAHEAAPVPVVGHPSAVVDLPGHVAQRIPRDLVLQPSVTAAKSAINKRRRVVSECIFERFIR